MPTVKKYIFDLVVLFIGVSLAFYVENFRQDINDKGDLEKYLLGLEDDLKSDSLIYLSSKKTLEQSLQRLDSLLLPGQAQIQSSAKVRLLVNSTLLIYDVGIDNNTNYKALINSGQLKLISDIKYRKDLKDYYRSTEVWLKNYENEFQTFRTNELFPFLNSQIDYGDFRWDNGLQLSSEVKTDPKIFEAKPFRNYLFRTRQFLNDFRTTMVELTLANKEILEQTRQKLRDVS